MLNAKQKAVNTYFSVIDLMRFEIELQFSMHISLKPLDFIRAVKSILHLIYTRFDNTARVSYGNKVLRKIFLNNCEVHHSNPQEINSSLPKRKTEAG